MQFVENVPILLRSFGSFRASFFFSILSIRACERSEAERVRCVVEAAPQARPEDHLGGIFCSYFVAEYHLGLTSALHIANTMVLSVFWQLRFLVILADFG